MSKLIIGNILELTVGFVCGIVGLFGGNSEWVQVVGLVGFKLIVIVCSGFIGGGAAWIGKVTVKNAAQRICKPRNRG